MCGLSVGGRASEAGISWVYCRVWHRVGCSCSNTVGREVAEERAEGLIRVHSRGITSARVLFWVCCGCQ